MAIRILSADAVSAYERMTLREEVELMHDSELRRFLMVLVEMLDAGQSIVLISDA